MLQCICNQQEITNKKGKRLLKMEKRFDYFICGDYEVCGKIVSCLIYTCGCNEENAKEVLEKTIANPPERCLGNIHIEKEERENCWWNQGNLD